MSESSSVPTTPPGVIPYVDHHTGPKRTVTLNLTSGNALLQSKMPPIVSIDGRQYVVYWGAVAFEVPADRACHLSVHVEGNHLGQHASVLLTPGDSLTLTYETNYSTGVGALR